MSDTPKCPTNGVYATSETGPYCPVCVPRPPHPVMWCAYCDAVRDHNGLRHKEECPVREEPPLERRKKDRRVPVTYKATP